MPAYTQTGPSQYGGRYASDWNRMSGSGGRGRFSPMDFRGPQNRQSPPQIGRGSQRGGRDYFNARNRGGGPPRPPQVGRGRQMGGRGYFNRGGGGGGAPGGNSGGLPSVPTFDFNQVPRERIDAAQANRLQGEASNQISTGSQDAIDRVRTMLAGTGASGAMAEKSAEIAERAGIEGGKARSEIGLGIARENAEHGLARGALGANLQNLAQQYNLGMGGLQLGAAGLGMQERLGNRGYDVTERGQDIGLQTAQGNQGLQWALGNLGANTTARGQDLGWLQSQLNANVTQRGQDVGYGGDVMDYWTSGRGQDVDSNRSNIAGIAAMMGLQSGERGQDINYMGDVANRGQDDWWRRLAQMNSMVGMFGTGSGQQGY